MSYLRPLKRALKRDFPKNNFCLAAKTASRKSYDGGKFNKATEVSSETNGRFVFAGDEEAGVRVRRGVEYPAPVVLRERVLAARQKGDLGQVGLHQLPQAPQVPVSLQTTLYQLREINLHI